MNAEDQATQRELRERVRALESELRELRQQVESDSPGHDIRELEKMERRWRKYLLQGVRGFAPTMAVNLHGTLYFFDTSDPKSARTLFVEQNVRRDQIHVRRAANALDSFLGTRPRELFLDVGAHIGTTTLYAVRHLGFSKAVAIEPSFENMRLLRLSVFANGLEGVVRTVHSAISDQQGVAGLDVGGLGSEYHRLNVGEGADLQQLVATTTLDALAEEGVYAAESVDLLWMDIEGFELRALEGASSLRERGTPTVIEMCPEKLERTSSADRVHELIGAHYTHALDLGKDRDSRFRPVAEIDSILAQYEGHCVDVLLCRQPAVA
ncbi:MAG: FkbM family methyltransferase [Gaiellaceae bacterium MAG52_C11]|nr:FkbM family methyltransferase [Candidatus Gaiellasilicea maunaloa]